MELVSDEVDNTSILQTGRHAPLSTISKPVNPLAHKPPLSHSDLVHWPKAGVTGLVRVLPELR